MATVPAASRRAAFVSTHAGISSKRRTAGFSSVTPGAGWKQPMSDSYALRTSMTIGAAPEVSSSCHSAGAAWRPACAGSAGVAGGAFSVTISATGVTA